MKILQLFKKFFGSTETTNPEILKMLREGSQLAVEEGKRRNYKLDYSDTSIRTMDQMLNHIRNENLRAGNPTLLGDLSIIFALYTIAVIEKNYETGYLQKRLVGEETDSLPYYYRGKLIFPYFWCLNKLSNKNAEDIWPQFQTLTSRK